MHGLTACLTRLLVVPCSANASLFSAFVLGEGCTEVAWPVNIAILPLVSFSFGIKAHPVAPLFFPISLFLPKALSSSFSPHAIQ
ncbi:Uncharacterized protein HZ326_20344 [Fusarium oxysporum f. sp. albedinis]|nr:Uncharacterized protein HZ326_20344 [Fusarium oxysporum f. sp. albedinis]